MELVYLLLSFLVLKTNAVAINGPPLTRYDPCGLGVVYFDKILSFLWMGVIDISQYPNLHFADIELTFNESVKMYGASLNGSIYTKDSERGFVFKPIGKLPRRYSFYLALKNNNTVDIPTLVQFKLNNVTLCNDDIKAEQTIESLSKKTNNTELWQVCGRRALQNAELTTVSTTSKAGDWPWHVAILFREPLVDNLVQYNCGGSIISSTAVLTAGHCVFLAGVHVEASRIVIEAGVDNIKDMNQRGRQILSASQVILHPAYSFTQTTADLAIIRVNKFVYTEFVQPICIWGPVYDKPTLIGQTAIVTGFGTTEQYQLSDKLRFAYTIVQNDSTCIAYSPNLYSSLLNEFTFCAGLGPAAGTNQLNGDSGGGLVLPIIQVDHKISWFLRGVLSKCGIPTGATLCDPKFYDIYTDVGPHYGWIYHNSGLNYISNIVA